MPRIGSLEVLAPPLSSQEIELLLAELTPTKNGQLAIGSSGHPPQLNTLTAGTGVSIINGPGTITISSAATGFSWNVASGVMAMSSGNGYIPNSGALVIFTLPIAPSVGDTMIILGYLGSWKIALSGGQQIQIGGLVATTSVSSTVKNDSIEIVCVDASGIFVVLDSEGNLLLT
jgi:hypothetical protein